MYRIKSLQTNKQRRTLAMEVLDALREAISTGKLRPNEKLVESQLTSALGVSRTPFREALNRLEVEGYVKRLPSGGYAVVDLSLQQFRELSEVRQALEGYMAQLVCERATKKQIKALERLQEKMKKAYEREDLDSIYKLNSKFHTELCCACGNEQLTAHVQALRGHFFSRRVFRFLTLSDWQESIAQHQQLIDAIKNHECVSISQIMHKHLQRSIGFYARQLT